MMTTAVFFVVVAAALAGVDGACKQEVIDKIKGLDTVPKTKITPQLVGEIVWLTAPSFLKGTPENYSCYETYIDLNVTSGDVYGTDFLFYNDESDVDLIGYDILEKDPGVLTFSGDEDENEIMYVAYFKGDVLAYYQCDLIASKFEGFGGLGVVNTNLSAPDYSTAHEPFLKEATAVLTDLGMAPLEKLNTDCY